MKESKYRIHDVGEVIDDIVELIKSTHDIKQTVKWYNDYMGSDIMKGSDCVPLKEKINYESWEFNNHGNGNDRPMIEMIVESVFSMGFQHTNVLSASYARVESNELNFDRQTLDSMASQIIKVWDVAIENNYRLY